MEKVGDSLREKIMIVDDTRLHRVMAADILARIGYATVEVEDGGKALEVVSNESPDLVILDGMMPDLDGLEVCRRLKDDPFTNHIPILIYSTDSAVSDQFRSMRNGADGYLPKPAPPEELVRNVETLLRRSFHLDSLTQLPAAPYLHRQIDARLAQNQPTAIVYCDIDNLRGYNQAYGHEAGDQLLIRVGRLMVDSLPSRGAVVGHLGSDDFIAVLLPEMAETFAQTVVNQFLELRKEFYSAEDLEQGYSLADGPRGEPRTKPLTSLSAAVVSNDQRALINYVQVSDLLSDMMRQLKAKGGNNWARERRLH